MIEFKGRAVWYALLISMCNTQWPSETLLQAKMGESMITALRVILSVGLH